MAGFDRTTQLAMRASREDREHHLRLASESRADIERHRKELATRALSTNFQQKRATTKQGAYDTCVNNMLELAHVGTESVSIEQRDLQEAAFLILEEPGISYLEKNVASIYATFPEYISALEQRNSPKETSYNKRRAAKLELARFNTVLKNFINDDPTITPVELQNYINDCALTYGYSGQKLEEISSEIPTLLTGMRHELAAESVLYRLDIDVEETDLEDDLNGVDYRVRRDDGTMIELDIKASEYTAQTKRARREKSFAERFNRPVPENSLIIASGFSEKDFASKSPWRLTEKAIVQAIPRFQRIIEQVPADTY